MKISENRVRSSASLWRRLLAVLMLGAAVAVTAAPEQETKPATPAPAATQSSPRSPQEMDPTLPALPKGVFDAVGAQATLTLLGATNAQESPRILLDVPDIYDRNVQIPVYVKAALPNVEAIVVLFDREPRPAIAGFAMRPVQDPEVAFVMSAKKTGNVKALVKSEGKWFYVQKTLRLATQAWK